MCHDKSRPFDWLITQGRRRQLRFNLGISGPRACFKLLWKWQRPLGCLQQALVTYVRSAFWLHWNQSIYIYIKKNDRLIHSTCIQSSPCEWLLSTNTRGEESDNLSIYLLKAYSPVNRTGAPQGLSPVEYNTKHAYYITPAPPNTRSLARISNCKLLHVHSRVTNFQQAPNLPVLQSQRFGLNRFDKRLRRKL